MAVVEKIITVTLKVKADNPVRMKDKISLLEKISNLPGADQERILKICENPKALKGLSENWVMLEGMIL
jgi:hypothetical protein